MKTGDITDAFLRALLPVKGGSPSAALGTSGAAAPSRPAAPAPSAPAVPAPPKGRPFLSEYHVRKALTPGSSTLTIPTDAIISPLAQEWLALQGVRIVRSS